MGIRPGISLGREDFARGSQRRTQKAAGQRMDGGFVYAIRGDHNLVKIGVSGNPNARLAQLRTASAFPLELCFVGACQTTGAEIEREAHRLLEPHRTNGEWFDCSPELAGSAIMGAAAKLNQKIAPVPPNMVDQIIAISTGQVALSEPKSPLLMRIGFWMIKFALFLAFFGVLALVGIAAVIVISNGK